MKNNLIRLAAVGDLAFGDHPVKVGNGVGTMLKMKGYAHSFANVSHLLVDYDAIFGNLEYALQPEQNSLDLLKSQCIADARNAAILRNAGFKFINMANNHIAQFGVDTYNRTVTLLKDNDIFPVGIADASSRESIPAVTEINGIKLGWLGYSLRGRQHFTDIPPYAEGVTENMLNEIQKLKDKVDHVIVSLHWGDEFIEKPSPVEIMMARKMIDIGASIILGHHPHVLRGIERYNNGLIAYSLGNFICDMVWEDRLRESMILEITMSNNEIIDFNIIPVFINDNFQPVVVTDGDQRGRFFERQRQRNEYIQKVLIECTAERYKDEALEELRKSRKAAHKYFVTHLYQYSPKIIIQQIVHSLKIRFRDGFYW